MLINRRRIEENKKVNTFFFIFRKAIFEVNVKL